MSHRPRTIRLLTAAAAWDNAANFQDSLNSTMRVGSSGRYVWDVNPSTRPAKSKRLVEILADEPVSTRDYNNARHRPSTSTPMRSSR